MDFFRTVTKTTVIAMSKPLEYNSDFDDSDTPPHTECNTKFMLKHFNNTKYKPNIKSKI